MCRFLIYSGQSPILLSHLITSPTHSILTQSYDSRLRLDATRPHNGDGFGVGYYTTAPTLAARKRGISDPVPKEEEFERLAEKTVSPLVFAHVRASTEGALSDSNCHPFSRGALMWMHNGGVGGWKLGVKRKLVTDISDRWFNMVNGSTDSEWTFALFLDSLEKMGIDPDDVKKQRLGFGHTVLRKAMLKTIERLNGFIKALPDDVKAAGDVRSLLNFAVADGKSVVCTRYVSSRTDEAASLFFSSGTSWREQSITRSGTSTPTKPGKGEYKMERRDKGADIVLVASEPLTFERDNWVTVPTNSVVTIHNQTVLIHPILDEFYNHAPSLPRSNKFAADKGQTTGDGMAEKKSTKAAIASSVEDLTAGVGQVALVAA